MEDENVRLVQILTVSETATDAITAVLREEGLDYGLSDHTGDPDLSTLVTFPLPSSSVEPVLDRIYDLELADTSYTLVVDTEAVVTDRDNHLDADNGEVQPIATERISRNELRSKARALLPDYGVYGGMTAIGAIVAATGFLLDSLAIVIGAMVIAPLFGPPIATSVATVTHDRGLFVESVELQLVGTGVGLLSSVAFSALVRYTALVHVDVSLRALLAMSSQTAPAFLLIVVAFSSGIAGALGIATNNSSVLTQVMIAAAIVPPVGAAGIGVAWHLPKVVAGSALVMLVNVLSVNLAAMVVLWYLGYHPEEWVDLRRTRGRILKLVVLLGGLIAALTLVFVSLADGTLATHV